VFELSGRTKGLHSGESIAGVVDSDLVFETLPPAHIQLKLILVG
jgi:hypothetical protein